MEEIEGVVGGRKELGTEKKLLLLGLLVVNFFIVVIAIFLVGNRPLPVTPRATGPTNFIQDFPTPSITQLERVKKLSYEEKANRLLELGIEIAKEEPKIEKISINQVIDKSIISISVPSAVMWKIEDDDSHILVFSDGTQSPELVRGNIYSRHIEGNEAITYQDKNNSELSGSIEPIN